MSIEDLSNLLKDLRVNFRSIVDLIVRVFRSRDSRRLRSFAELLHDEATYLLSDAEVYYSREKEIIEDACKLHALYVLALALADEIERSRIRVSESVDVRRCVEHADLTCATNVMYYLSYNTIDRRYENVDAIRREVEEIARRYEYGGTSADKGRWLALRCIISMIDVLNVLRDIIT